MAFVFKPTYSRPIPEGAKTWRLAVKGKDVPAVRYTDNRGTVHTRPLTKDGARMILEQRHWWGCYTRPDGTRARFKGHTDKTATEQEAARREREAAGQAAGLTIVDEAHLSAAIATHIEAYAADLDRGGRSKRYCVSIKARLTEVTNNCKWLTLSNVRPESLTNYLARLTDSGKAWATVNGYLTAAKSFVNWLVKQGRLAANPLHGVSPAKKSDPVYTRRALTDAEARTLLAVAPEYRRIIYLTALRTGLRRSEMAALQWGDVHLGANERPHIALRVSATKARRADAIPLRDDLAAELRKFRPAFVAPNVPVFDCIPTTRTLREDLTNAEIPHMDARGRAVDFHSLRYTFATMLARDGVHPRTAQLLMRHSDVNLTMSIYSDLTMVDTAAAVGNLPSLAQSAPQEALQARTGTYDAPAAADSPEVLTKKRAEGCISAQSDAVSSSIKPRYYPQEPRQRSLPANLEKA